MADGGNQRVMFPVNSVRKRLWRSADTRAAQEATGNNRSEPSRGNKESCVCFISMFYDFVFHNSEKGKSEPELMNSP